MTLQIITPPPLRTKSILHSDQKREKIFVCTGTLATQRPFSVYLTLNKLSLLYLTLPYLTLPYLTLPYLTSPHLISPHLTSPHLTSPHLTSPHLTSPHLTSPHLTSPHLTSPHHYQHHQHYCHHHFYHRHYHTISTTTTTTTTTPLPLLPPPTSLYSSIGMLADLKKLYCNFDTCTQKTRDHTPSNAQRVSLPPSFPGILPVEHLNNKNCLMIYTPNSVSLGNLRKACGGGGFFRFYLLTSNA